MSSTYQSALSTLEESDTSDVLTYLDRNEFSAKTFAIWILKFFKIGDRIPDFSFNHAGDITPSKFWFYLKYKGVPEIKRKGDEKRLFSLVTAIENLYDLLPKSEFIEQWCQISRFLKDLQNKLDSQVIILFAALVSATLLDKYLSIPHFNTDRKIVERMVFSVQCGSFLAKENATWMLEKQSVDTMQRYTKCADQFLGIIRKSLIFYSDDFAESTKALFVNIKACVNETTIINYLDCILSALQSQSREVMELFKYCTDELQIEEFIKLLSNKPTKHNKEVCQIVLDILIQLLDYSRVNKICFQYDWSKIFAATLFHPIAEIRETSLKLLIFKSELTEQNELANELTLMENAVRAYRHLHKDIQTTNDFIDLFKEHESFEACDKLLHLLRLHSSNDPTLCLGITFIIKCAAANITEMDKLETLAVKVFETIVHLEAHANVMCRLMDMLDFSSLKKYGKFQKEISLVKNSAVQGLKKSDQYTTAIILSEILKELGLDDYTLVDIFSYLLDLLVSGGASDDEKRAYMFTFMAMSETFNIFEKLPICDDFAEVQYFFKHRFECSDEALLVALNVVILKGWSNKGIPSVIVDKETKEFHKRITDLMKTGNGTTFHKMMLGIAYCEFYSKFFFKVEDKFTQLIFSALVDVSEEYDDGRPEFDNSKDFRLIARFYGSMLTFLRKPSNFHCPAELFSYYYYANLSDKLIPYVEEIIIYTLECYHFRIQFGAFTYTLSHVIEYLSPATDVVPLVKKMFQLIEKSAFAGDKSSIAYAAFDSNLNKIISSKRFKTIFNVQKYLYSLMSPERGNAALNQVRDMMKTTSDQRRLKELLQIKTKKH